MNPGQTNMILAYGVILLAIVLMVVLIVKTDIINDSSTQPLGQKPYSLARTQMAFWTLIIFCSFVYLWGAKEFKIDKSLKLGETALVLLGVGAGTTMLGKAIDESDKKNVAMNAIPNRHQNSPSRGFLWDLLTDNDGISIVRFQNVAFTVALMVGFVITIAKTSPATVAMPEFDQTLLILSGVSSGGYLGAKLSENK